MIVNAQQQQFQNQLQQQQATKRIEKKNKKLKDFTPVYVWGSDTYGQLGLASREFGKSCPSPRFTSFSVVIEDIACGEEHTSFIAQNGYVYSMGNNNQGQLGVSVDESYYKSAPTLVEGLKGYKAVQISCGAYHTATVCDNGQLFTWGQNCEGQLGIGKSDNMTTPQIVDLKNNLAVFVSCGKRNTMVITQTQKIFGFGDGKCGQLGLGNECNEYKPRQLQIQMQNIVAISCGDRHTLFLNEEGEAFSCGNNTYNQLGCANNSQSSNIPVKVKQKSTLKFVKVIAANTPMSAALSSEGYLYLWGTGFFGQFDRPTRCEFAPKDLLDICIGNQFICLLDGEGKVYSWGSNMFGELGQGIANGQQALEPIQVDKIKDKNVKRLYCGANFVFAMGENWIHQQQEASSYENSKQSKNVISSKRSGNDYLNSSQIQGSNSIQYKNEAQMDILRRMSDTPYFEDVATQQQNNQNNTTDYLNSKVRQSTSNFAQNNSNYQNQQSLQSKQQLNYYQQYNEQKAQSQQQDNSRVYSEQSFQEKKPAKEVNFLKSQDQQNLIADQKNYKESYQNYQDNYYNDNQDINISRIDENQDNSNYDLSNNDGSNTPNQKHSTGKKSRVEYGMEQFETYHDQNSQSKYSNTGRNFIDQDESYLSREQSPISNKENTYTGNKSLKQQYKQQQYSSHKKTNNPSPNQLSFDDSQIYEPIDYSNFISDSKQSKPSSVQKPTSKQQTKGTSLITYNKPIQPSNSKDSSLQGTIQLNNYFHPQAQNTKHLQTANFTRERSYSTQQQHNYEQQQQQTLNCQFFKGNINKQQDQSVNEERGDIYEIKYKQLKLKYERTKMERDEYHEKLNYEREVNKNLLIRLERKTKKQRELEKRLEFLNMDLQMNKRTYDMKIEELLKKLASYESKIETKQYKDLNFLKSYDESALDKSTNRNNLSDINSQIITLKNKNYQNDIDNNSSGVSESYNIVMKDETPSKMLKNKNQTVSFSPLNQSDFSAIDQHNTTINSKLNQTGNIFNNTSSTLNNTLSQINNIQNQNFVDEILDKYNKRQLNKQNPLMEQIMSKHPPNPLAKKDLNVNTELDFSRQYKTLNTCPNTYNNYTNSTTNSYVNSVRNNLFSQPYSTKNSIYTRPSSTTAHSSTFTDKPGHSRALSSQANQYRQKIADKKYF
ncbi:regulator of chromosome condensation (RCC1) protein (macronuclear) [Tetrahymena thermophila SB210]|uniref:Regulator of chromosome condensation (RCC1) protein n=1 Tax=Tetrahymena thermophila (strain SB210) TaxID=312017 RepID=Q22WS4_TETTS|nr:regulator of chromosome condensation (RCC1) protein [Tetrahymena thermophila SB210]EAR89718.1 regulator of chromosome condensation (RCC1) protein [Tetrahymena thermophila SB210]|eukprot:XP_001009963.1 regulator of chromosome condensation (RCC1) protein [Tetrahymena thermophila SB210]